MKRLRLFGSLLLLGLLNVAALAQNAPARVTIKSAVLGEERAVLVRTPPDYNGNNQRYPVLYMTDGAAHLNHTISTIEFLTRSRRMPELIVVAITNTDRTRDLTPTKAALHNPNGQPANFPTAGGADKFLQFIETELIPKIESSHRTQPYRIFAGHSFGGLLALHAFLNKTELFNAYIAASPTMEWDNHLLSRRAAQFFKDRQELNRTLYITLGNEGGATQTGFDRFKAILAKQQAKHFVWDTMLMPDEDHGTVVLPSHYYGLRKVFAGWQGSPNLLAGGLPAVEAHYKQLSARFNYEVLPPEPVINQLGYQLLAQGQMDEAINVFKSNIARYPQSANVYDSLAEAYEKQGKLDLARPNYEKAVQLGQQNNDPNLTVYKTNFDRVSETLKKEAAAKGK
jgi:uncharacterized protein